VALEALRGELTVAKLTAKHGIHQTMVGDCKQQAKEGLAAVFSNKSAESLSSRQPTLEQKINAAVALMIAAGKRF
jgi:transposase